MKIPKEYGKKKATGRSPTLTMDQKRAIARRAYLEKQSSTQVKIEMNLRCTIQTVRNVLQKNFNFTYAKFRSCPHLQNI